MRLVGLKKIGKERPTGGADASERDAPDECSEDETNYVVPIEQLKTIAGSELDGISPRSPADHAEEHEAEDDDVGFRLIQAIGPRARMRCFQLNQVVRRSAEMGVICQRVIRRIPDAFPVTTITSSGAHSPR